MPFLLANYTHQGFAASAAYAEITALAIDLRMKSAQITLGIWASREYHDAGNPPADVKGFQITGDLLTEVLADIGSQLLVSSYASLQKLPAATALLQGAKPID